MSSKPLETRAADISRATGLEVAAVSKVLTELANQAYANAAAGFVLPGFGKFRLVPGAGSMGVNPFTGKPVIFRAPPEIEFTIDTVAKKCFRAGKAESSETTSQANTAAELLPVALLPKPEDLRAAGIKGSADYRCKIGGTPDWLQAPTVPICCGDAMLFYGQLDSLNNGDYCNGDMGRLYVFVCRQCCNSRSILQF